MTTPPLQRVVNNSLNVAKRLAAVADANATGLG